ncbi:GNAT family N-acetyltransferase [Frigidibacter sp. MR17.14]|uniref:GNAT family N-acetyltransferase n=1 Tax=Frigidibacter sp. MR17.14 TaxID=3126509 RepID=UPI003012E583
MEPPRRLTAGDDMAPVLALIRAAFSYMDGRIDPPSSLHLLTEATLAAEAARAELWVIGDAPLACVILTPKPGRLYIGKLAVAEAARGRGLGRALVTLAEARARELCLPALELQTRVELVENHRTFAAMGFERSGATNHPGHDRPTSFTYRRAVGAGGT